MLGQENKTIEELDEELEDEQKRLKQFPSHGVHLGMAEFQDMVKNHPVLIEFFDKADEVLGFSKEKSARLVYLEQRFIDGELTEDEFNELKRDFYKPYLEKKQPA